MVSINIQNKQKMLLLHPFLITKLKVIANISERDFHTHMNGNMLLKEFIKDHIHGVKKLKDPKTLQEFQLLALDLIIAQVLICSFLKRLDFTVHKEILRMELKTWLAMFGNLLMNLKMSIQDIFYLKEAPNTTCKTSVDGKIKMDGIIKELDCGISPPHIVLLNHGLLHG